MAPGDLIANDHNWRGHPPHQQEAIAAALDRVGWVQSIVVNERTGSIVDGHLRVALALAREESAVPVQFVDLAASEERLVLATLDPLAALAVTDEGALKGLLSGIDMPAELDRLMGGVMGSPEQTASTMPTQDDIDRTEAEMADRYVGRQPDLSDVTCPDCGHTFGVNRKAFS